MKETTKQPSFARSVMSMSSRKLVSASKRSLSRFFPKQPSCISKSGPLTTSGRGDEDAECRDVWEAAETNRLSSWKSSLFGSSRMSGVNLSFRRSFRDGSTDGTRAGTEDGALRRNGGSAERCKSMRLADENSQGVSSGTVKDYALENGPESPLEKDHKEEALTKVFTELHGWNQESESPAESDDDAESVSTSEEKEIGRIVMATVGEGHSECSEEKPAGDDGSGNVDSGKDQAGAEQDATTPTRGWNSPLNGVLNLEIPGSPDRQSNADSPDDAEDDEGTPTTPVSQIRIRYSGPIVRQVKRHELGGLPRVRSSECEDGKYPRKPSRSVTTTPRGMVRGYSVQSPSTPTATVPHNAGFNTPQARRGAGFNSPSARASRATRPEFCRSVTSEQLGSRPSMSGAGYKSPLGHRRRDSADLSSPLCPVADDLAFPLNARGKVAAAAYLGQRLEQRKYPAAVSDSWVKSSSTDYGNFATLVHTDSQ